MNAAFRYKQKFFPTLILMLVFGALGFIFYTQSRFTELWIDCAVFAALEIVVFLYYLTKRLVLDDEGIAVCVFWKLGVSGARWEQMEEASLTSRRLIGSPRAGQAMEISFVPGGMVVEPGGAVKATQANLIRIIRMDAEPFYINMRALVKASGLPDLIAQKTDFVK